MERKKGKNVKKYHSRGSEFDALEGKKMVFVESAPDFGTRYFHEIMSF